jgi:hypothetical protein
VPFFKGNLSVVEELLAPTGGRQLYGAIACYGALENRMHCCEQKNKNSLGPLALGGRTGTVACIAVKENKKLMRVAVPVVVVGPSHSCARSQARM